MLIIYMNSLNKRIERIESSLESDNDLIVKLKRKQAEKKQSLMNDLTGKYLEYLEKQSICENVEINLIEVLYYTIKYVESNKQSISRLLEIKVNDENAEDIIIYLIQINVPDVNEGFISKGIKFLNSLDMKQDEIVDAITTKSKKKWFANKNVIE
jgi:hypothetical protein